MKILFYLVIGLPVIIAMVFIILSIASRKQPELGLVNNQLQACPSSPNCVCSEFSAGDAYINPLEYSIARKDVWQDIKTVIKSTGGEILQGDEQYLHAIYVTPLMRYVDDVEFRLDMDHHVIHIRSASRVGRSDMGANRKRVERIRAAFTNM
ncbi:MAG: DUF1499 domain-containing protein [Gammaproteobacteria bacterium]|nr:DUF1499 domain-containing protein [Gammaproteobacteria bacterium]